MRNKCAVVIVYDGKPIEGEEHRKIAEALMNNTDAVQNGETIEVYGLNSNDIAKAITIKAVCGNFYPDNVPIETEFDAAARCIYEYFASSMSVGMTEFAANLSAVYVSIKLCMFQLAEKDANIVRAVELLAQDGAYDAISAVARRKYHVSKNVITTIKNIYDSVCRGHIVSM